MNYEPKESNAHKTAEIWARQFGKIHAAAVAGAAVAPSHAAPAAAVNTPVADRPSTESVWAKQFGGARQPITNRPSTEAVWARQFHPKQAATSGTQQPSPDRGDRVLNALGACGFRISDIKACAPSVAEIRIKLRSPDVLMRHSAEGDILALGSKHPEFWKLLNEYVDAVAPAAA